MLTIADVKRELPSVKARIGKREFTARVTGRANQFATVTILADDKPLRGVPWIDAQFSWESVTRAINENRALQF
jgi:hypothetical protein